MSSNDLSALNSRFAIPGHVQFKEGPGGLTVAEITNSLAESTIALQGAHVMTWQPHGQAPVLWLSRFGKFAPGKSIRGGVPVCWPWFGPHAEDAKLPGHGFARTVMWEVQETRAQPDGATFISFGLIETDATRAQWPHPSSAKLRVTVGAELKVELATRNTGSAPFQIGEALHTYFHISDVADMKIKGLEGCTYLDKVGGTTSKTQQGPIVIESEVDRVYLNTESDCLIEDLGLKRQIRIATRSSRSTVVWNPWIEKAEKMGDFGPEGYRGMVCVESANAVDNVVTVLPGAEHILQAMISVEALA
ncbi:aldose 1-epimerase [Sulfuricella denitrificans skB26]|uniref:Putative glucose-6-phosphate 1-epimerase n=1 Tax=Sulfuricella denitrificans (strain DSM 22764 / NBRC 105220 / skB26) TaxID=1163617 RepID=S6AZZ2_SULDS|nr:D-hexose-6-phosphate mutarotase [Sulfuricella denitrificans]BAN34067.1 aldose 1-epimerase [Sulfuricella denitrificans skB26]